MTISSGVSVLREALPADRAKLESLIQLADEFIGYCQHFYFRMRLIQTLQLDILRPISESNSPFQAFMEASERGEIKRLIGHYEADRKLTRSEASRLTTQVSKDLLQYLNLDALRCDENHVETLQRLQSRMFAADISCRWTHDHLRELAEDLKLPDCAFDEPTRKKFAEWQAECESKIAYYRAWRDAEVPFVEAFIKEAKQQLAKAAARKLTVDEANAKAMALANADPEFVNGSQRDWAKAIGCATGQITKLPFWQAVAERTGRSRKGKVKTPKAVALTDKILATMPDQDHDAEMARLVAEQKQDAEPSPLEEDRPGSRKKVRNRKKL